MKNAILKNVPSQLKVESCPIMSDTAEELRQQLESVRRALAESAARCAFLEAEVKAAASESEDARYKIERAHQEWIAALDVVKDPIFMHDEKCRVMRCNKAYQNRAGLPFRQIIGRPYYEIFPKLGAPHPCCQHSMEEDVEGEEEILVGETSYRIRTYPIADDQGNYLYSMHILEDVTERKQINDALRVSEDRYRTIIENSNDLIWTLSVDGRFTFINKQAAYVTGLALEDWLGKSFAPLVVEEDLPMILEIHAKILQGEKAHYEVRGWKADRSLVTLSVNASPIFKNGAVVGSISFAKDVTELKRTEAAMVHANRALATLSTVNRTLVHADNEGELLQSICQAIVHQRGYRLAWVGYMQHDESKTIKVKAHAGDTEGYFEVMQLSWGENDRGMGPSGRAIRSGETQLCQDIARDQYFPPWRDETLRRGYLSNIALPLKDSNNMVFGTLVVYSDEVNAFTSDEIRLLEEMAGDLAFGVKTLKVRRERDLALEQNQRQLIQLRDSLEDTVRAIATIVEMRDPYTAGHQSRVADLAVNIARKLGLPDEQVHAVQLAGIVHDLGKIKVPAEILSKPGRITDIEYSLIKNHPQAGYDILKDIEFPWPIAQIVLQHHERLDGSGYPQGLKGEQIILGARILSVADVVEAMSSHRPYRPGLGVDAALEEISKRRDAHYDPQVVDVCIELLKQGYTFPK